MSRTANQATTSVATVVSADALLALAIDLELVLIIGIVGLLPITEGCGPPS